MNFKTLTLAAALVGSFIASATDGSFIQGEIDAAPDGGTVELATGTYELAAPLLITGKAITLKSQSGNPADVILDGQNTSALLNAKSASTIAGITFVNGAYQRDDNYEKKLFGGPVALKDGATLTNCVVRDCTVRIVDGIPNFGGGYAGGVMAQGAGTLVVDCLIRNCAYIKTEISYWRIHGGGLAVLKGAKAKRCLVTGCSVQNYYNNASQNGIQGGGVYIANATVEDSVICSNRCVQLHPDTSYALAGTGGGVSMDSDQPDSLLVNCLVISNRAQSVGGGIFVGQGTVRGCTIADNKSDVDGLTNQAIYGAGANVTSGLIEDSLLCGNSSTTAAASCGGGGLQLATGGRLYGSIVSNNTCASAGGIKFSPGGTGMVVSNCWITANKATSNGGGCTIYGRATLLVTDTVISDNHGGMGSICWWQCWNGVYDPSVFRNCLLKGKSGQCGLYMDISSAGSHPLVFENCTVTGCKDAISTASKENLFVKGCVFAGNTTDFPDMSGTLNVSNTYVYSSASALLPSGFGNHSTDDIADPKFVNAAVGDWRLRKDSPLLDLGGAAEEWMGAGKRKGPQDMGDGTFSTKPAATISVLGKSYDVGVKLTRNSTRRRLYNNLPDPGCFEYAPVPGLMMMVR